MPKNCVCRSNRHFPLLLYLLFFDSYQNGLSQVVEIMLNFQKQNKKTQLHFLPHFILQLVARGWYFSLSYYQRTIHLLEDCFSAIIVKNFTCQLHKKKRRI
jgi:hypothetical protein